ncbi:MAG: hypothetical protein A2Z02_02615 [Chloroflexi bacterium RBG_16_48_7]|nr:MAG: hypothetical protein A2Z02_02615 [Chloroflexi bacterium RBG_16_48_7]
MAKEATLEQLQKRIVKLEQQMGKLMIDKYCMLIPQYMQGRPYISSKKVNGHDLEKIWIHQWIPENVWLSK